VGHRKSEWYAGTMSGTYNVTVGDRGRLVLPSDLRERAGLAEGSELVLMETEGAIVLFTREQLKARVRADLADRDLVGSLIAERRSAAQAEDASA
jgi:AbrB family looped-hinge helix DNA binding protein